MKARLTPLYFEPGRDEDFDIHLTLLTDLLADDAVFTAPVPLGSAHPQTDAVVFPQMLGQAYSRIEDFRALQVPILVVTSKFGTVNMWDWEIIKYLELNKIETICPPSLEATKMACRALSVKRRMNDLKFVVYQDDPAGPTGKQSEIFKRFYWLEQESTEQLERKFGITIESRSFRELGARAAAIPDEAAQKVIDEWPSNSRSVQGRPLLSAIKLYMELDRDYHADANILAMGLNCLNESQSCDTTPCLAWNLLYEREHLVWGCEADTMVMMTEVFVDKVIEAPFFMTNLYNRMSISQAELTGYIHYEDSDCLNGGIIRVRNGHNFVDKVASHHYVVVSGHHKPAFQLIAKIFDFEPEEI